MRWSFSPGKVAGIEFQPHIAFIILPAAIFFLPPTKSRLNQE
ncbi:MAG TPA: hypothetical protein VMW72_16105 [Sedimentisphaerales bacterium]|nr:hypothetical protein [Sedimentisphaerales bacterium]